MAGVGVSMGAGSLAKYNAKKGKSSKFDACVGISCAFDIVKAHEHIKTSHFGIYDAALGRTFASYADKYYKQFDILSSTEFPERVVGNEVRKVTTGSGITNIFAKAAGKSIDQYMRDGDINPILGSIKIPFFFLSSRDDPFFGSDLIPINHSHKNILLGVLNSGGHCCTVEGGLLPTGCWWTKPSFVFIDHFMKKALKIEETGDNDSYQSSTST